ncbi:FERM, ARHGEF and pleckstrin domain-containing protein 2-like [Acropora millepora]|uniref:FERM, ARHGEF and pleckstrin domain-containing protein 2-like n=1 Tax=Acropora millepora TaxID=45264 RepID=UPI001CF3F2F3|nr:FERM, ARHGEF and pleckstrin domain-containing protein 2-like [Acropora millepora]
MPKCKGQALYDDIYDQHLNIEEQEYFGINFHDKNDKLFEPRSTLFRFCVKFYPPDPALLQKEYTRYLFALQIKRDLLSGRLKCSENTAALSNWHLTLFKENLVIMTQGPVEVDIYQNVNSFLIRLQILKKEYQLITKSTEIVIFRVASPLCQSCLMRKQVYLRMWWLI